MTISNSTTLNDLVGQIVSEQAVSAAYANRVLRPLVSGRLVPPGAGSIVVPKFGTLAVSSLTEGVAPSSTALSTDGVTLTPVERGVYVQISKHVLYADPWVDLSPYGDQIGRAMAADEDAQLLAAMDFSTHVNTGSDAMVLDDFLEAISTLEAANAPQPYYGVFHPLSWAKLRKALGDASAFAGPGRQQVEGFGPGAPNSNGYVGSPFGIPCFISSQVDAAAAGATPTRRENLVFSQQAVACAWMNDIRIDVDDNVVARAIDLMGWYTVDCDKLVDAYGVVIDDTLT